MPLNKETKPNQTKKKYNCGENWDENSPSPQHKCQHLCSACKIHFGKNMGAPSELKPQMVMFLHADSHVKPHSEDAHANEGRQKRT